MSLWPSLQAVLLTLAALVGIGALCWARTVREQLDEYDEEERLHDERMSMWGHDL